MISVRRLWIVFGKIQKDKNFGVDTITPCPEIAGALEMIMAAQMEDDR
jgi:hypothetical protein